MIFVGDIALPYSNSIQIKNLPEELRSKKWFVNLEGSLVDNYNGKFKKSRAVFNDIRAINELAEKFNFVGFALANNHITDLAPIEVNLNYLEKINVQYCGIGNNIIDASKPLVFDESGYNVVILNFGWEVIQCEIASKATGGVNPLTKKNVVEVVSKYKKKFPTSIIIAYMHWSYELEAEPQPLERELAKKIIDLGVAGVIGSHPHRVGGFELYKNKPIVYSLGNWMFKQNYFFDGKLSFPDFCKLELAFEWNFGDNSFKFHFFEYDRNDSTLTYLRTEDKDSLTMLKLTPFFKLTNNEYEKWYKQNHYHKNKGLPIYYWDDSQNKIQIKDGWVKTRAKLMKLFLNKGK